IVSTPDPEFIRSWEITRSHLYQALRHLPKTVSNTEARDALTKFNEYLDHNELGLAFEELYHVGTMTSAPEEFWRQLRLAANNMGLVDWLELIDQRLPR